VEKQIFVRMSGELIPQIVIRAAERRGSADEIVTRWIAQACEERPADVAKLWTDHFASVADYWRHKVRHLHGHAGAMVVLYEWAQRMTVTA
jgi:hypothetical protein